MATDTITVNWIKAKFRAAPTFWDSLCTECRQQSIHNYGVSCKIGKEVGWNIAGPTQDHWHEKIKPVVSAHWENIPQKDFDRRAWIGAFLCLMVGRTPETSRPTVVMRSAETRPYESLKRLLKQDRRFRDSGFRFICSKGLIRMATGRRTVLPTARTFQSASREPLSADASLCGNSLFVPQRQDWDPVRINEASALTRGHGGMSGYRTATIGDVVGINFSPFALTIAHLFMDEDILPRSRHQKKEDGLSDSGSIIDTWEDSDEDLSDSTTPPPQEFPILQPRTVFMRPEEYKTADLVLRSELKPLEPIGEFPGLDPSGDDQSKRYANPGLDWSLVPLEKSDFDKSFVKVMRKFDFGATEKVIILCKNSHFRKSTLSGMEALVSLPGSFGLQKSYVLNQDDEARVGGDGESGAFVVSEEDGVAYGMMVMHDKDMGMSYALPLDMILQDIKANMAGILTSVPELVRPGNIDQGSYLLNEVSKKLVDMGLHGRAIELAQRNLWRTRTGFSVAHKAALESCTKITATFVKRGLWAMAQQLCLAVLVVVNAESRFNYSEAMKIFSKLVVTVAQSLQVDRAETLLLALVQAGEKHLTPQNSTLLSAMSKLASYYSRLHLKSDQKENQIRIAESIEMLEAVIRLPASNYKEEQLRVSALKLELANAYLAGNQVEKAIGILEVVDKQHTKLLSPDNYNRRGALPRRKRAYATDDNLAKCIEILEFISAKQSQVVAAQTFEKKDSITLLVATGLGRAYRATAREELAISILDEMVTQYQKSRGERPLHVRGILLELGRAYQADRKTTKAIEVLTLASVKLEDMFDTAQFLGPNVQSKISDDEFYRHIAQLELGTAYRATKNIPKAIEVLEELRETNANPGHESYSYLLQGQLELARAYQDNKQTQEAIELLQRTEATIKQAPAGGTISSDIRIELRKLRPEETKKLDELDSDSDDFEDDLHFKSRSRGR